MTARLIGLLKMYLTPPSEEDGQPRRSFHATTPPTSLPPNDPPPPIDEDEIYKNVEFRKILTDCIDLLADGRTIMEKLYSSVVEENGSMSGEF